MIGLSVLIPLTPDRYPFILLLKTQFEQQLGIMQKQGGISIGSTDVIWREFHNDVEVIYFEDQKNNTIGYKRNVLKDLAQGKYLAFVDSDDRIGPNYFKHAFTGIEKGVDACGLTGIITEDGQNPKKFVHSMKYDSWYEKDGVYYRGINHLNTIRSTIAKRMTFPEINHGEDKSFSDQIMASGLIKTEYWDEQETIYFYDYRSRK